MADIESDRNIGMSTPDKTTGEDHDGLDRYSDDVKLRTNLDDGTSRLDDTVLSSSSSHVNETEISVDTPNDSGPQWATAGELGVEDEDVPTIAAGIRRHNFLPAVSGRTVGMVVGNCTREMAKEQRPIRQDEKQAVFSILKAFNSITPLTASISEEFRLDGLLRLILGETGFECKPFEYPEPLQRNALILSTRLGAEVEAAADGASAASLSPESSSSTSSNARDSKRSRTSGSSPQSTGISSVSGHLDLDDPLLKNAMRGIVFSGSQRRSYRLDPNDSTHVRNCNIFGDNGLEVGQWWPLRVCALRDGAHGAIQGGIAGNARHGAFSVVVSSEYTGLDIDQGVRLYYSGSNAQQNKDPKVPQISYMTRALRLSFTNNRPIRVIRSGTADGIWAPRVGLRYDGLYKIVREKVRLNKQKGAYVRFEMRRLVGQTPLGELAGRPDRKEREVWDRLKGST